MRFSPARFPSKEPGKKPAVIQLLLEAVVGLGASCQTRVELAGGALHIGNSGKRWIFLCLGV